MRPTIHIRGLTKAFAGTPVLRGLDLDVHAGEILGFIGPNGAGKTTTLRIVCGMLDDFGGEVVVCGHDVATDPVAVKRRIGYVPEVAALYDELTAMEFLRFTGALHGLADADLETRARSLLACFGLETDAEARMSSFSKGMRQKVLLTSALLHDPDVLVLDEPLSGLDAATVMVVKAVLMRLAGNGKSVFYSSHVMDVVERVCDRIVLITDGAIAATGTFDELQAASRGGSLEHIVAELTSADEHDAIAERVVAAMRPVTSTT
jgi:ABC-2 type transport system ATP-binding protein